MSTEKKTKENQPLPAERRNDIFGRSVLGEAGHPGEGHEQVGGQTRTSWGAQHSRASLIVFDDAGRRRWAAAHNHCGSINSVWDFFPFSFVVFFFLPSHGH